MIHTKSLIRRLAYVPWLLAFGLVLGWAGEAAAQEVRLSANVSEIRGSGVLVTIREDGGPVTIKVTAKTYNAAGEHEALGVERVVQLNATAPFNMVTGPTNEVGTLGPDRVGLGAQGAEVDGFGRRFTMTLPTIVIPKDAKEVSVESVFTPIPTNHENNSTVTTGDNPYKEERIPNEDLLVFLTGDAGGAVKVDHDGSEGGENWIIIEMLDTDKPSYEIKLALDPEKISKEAERTAVEVAGRLDGAKVNQPLSILLGVLPFGTNLAGRDADYDIELSTLTIPRKKSSGSATIYITPKNAGTGTIWIWGGAELMVTGTDINQDGDTRDEWPASIPGANAGDPPTAGPFIDILEVALREDLGDVFIDNLFFGMRVPEAADYDPDGTDDDITQTAYDVLTDPPEGSDAEDPDGDSYFAYSEAGVMVTSGVDGWDLNGDGDTEDFLKVVREKEFRHRLFTARDVFTIDAGAIAATKGLTATPAEIRESVVGQTEESREVSVELKIELENALPDDARVRFFVRDQLTQLEDAFIEDAQAATRGTHYTATVDDLVIPAGEKRGRRRSISSSSTTAGRMRRGLSGWRPKSARFLSTRVSRSRTTRRLLPL